MNLPPKILTNRQFITALRSINNINVRGLCEQKRNDRELPKELRIPEDYDPSKFTNKDFELKSWTEDDKQYFKTLRSFYSDANHVEISRFLQTPIDLSPSSILKWFNRKNREKDIVNQSFMPERNRILGNELAAAHLVVFRGGSVKFHGDNHWIKADKNGDYNLPNQFVGNRYLEAIDCTDMKFYYEGLQNFRNLRHVNWLSVNGCNDIDDWCVDTICGMFHKSLVYLDLRNCPNVTELGLTALWKMQNLKILYLDDVLRSSSYEMTVLLLEEHLPQLEIKVGDLAEDD